MKYPIQINGKILEYLEISDDLSKIEIEHFIKNNNTILKHLNGKPILKVIIVLKLVINIVF